MSAVQIFSVPQVILLCTGVGASTLGFPLDRTDFKLFRGLLNTIQILIRDVDRVPVSFASGVVPMINIIQRDTKQVLFSGPLTLVDAGQSLWSFTVGPSDIADWSSLKCTYTIVTQDANGNLSALYMDRDYNHVGEVEICDGPYPDAPSAVVLTSDAFLTKVNSLYSGAIPGAAQLNNLSGLHTFVVYGEGLNATVVMQASLDASAPTIDEQWLTVATLSVTNLSGVQSFNVEGNYVWVRFIVTVASGTFQQVMCRS